MKPARVGVLLTVASLAAVAACGSSSTEVGGCSREATFGISVSVVDSLTGQPPGAATVTVTEGAYTASVTGSAPAGGAGTRVLNINLAGERPGTYTVLVTADGYLEWNTSGVQVVSDGCHVKTVNILARLVKDA